MPTTPQHGKHIGSVTRGAKEYPLYDSVTIGSTRYDTRDSPFYYHDTEFPFGTLADELYYIPKAKAAAKKAGEEDWENPEVWYEYIPTSEGVLVLTVDGFYYMDGEWMAQVVNAKTSTGKRLQSLYGDWPVKDLRNKGGDLVRGD